MKKTLALSVKQPFAQLIIDGIKDVENRSWPPPESIIGKRIYIHAGKTKISRKIMALFEKWKPGTDFEYMSLDPNEYTYGAIIGSVKVEGYTKKSKSDWANPGAYHWELSSPKKIKPIPFKGQLKLFNVAEAFKK